MSYKLLLVDYENVQQLDFRLIDDGIHVVVFVGASQKNIPIDLVSASQRLGSRVEWHQISGNGRNALDFHIACELGRTLERTPSVQCIVLSKDTGFDPLIKYLNKHGLKCKRINSLLELHPKGAPASEPNYKRVIDILGKSPKQSRPRTRLTLSKHVAAMFAQKIAEKDVNRIVDLLFANKMVSESNGRIAYEF